MDIDSRASLSMWNNIYDHFSPVAFEMFGISVHWYGLAYVSALAISFFLAKLFINKLPRFRDIDPALFDSYFIWAEIGIILGARFGYLLIYTDEAWFYATHPWQAFNPYVDGEFVGIAGMSFHGAVVGFLLASFVFCLAKKLSKSTIFGLLDVAALSIPLGYFFGRVGNFLNKELYGREVTQEWLRPIGIYVEGALRYPSQLIEAALEGLVLFVVVYLALRWVRLRGGLMAVYAIGYALARFVAEYFREADSQLGYYFLGLSMGQILSLALAAAGGLLWWFLSCNKCEILDEKLKVKPSRRKASKARG